jgi:hypothetical protein
VPADTAKLLLYPRLRDDLAQVHRGKAKEYMRS